jgi:hypothetical protein
MKMAITTVHRTNLAQIPWEKWSILILAICKQANTCLQRLRVQAGGRSIRTIMFWNASNMQGGVNHFPGLDIIAFITFFSQVHLHQTSGLLNP